jgi:Flp pilus assembly protein TadD
MTDGNERDTPATCKQLVDEAFAAPQKWARNLARAEALLTGALAEEPANALLLTCLGAVLCDSGQHARAVAALRDAVRHGAQDGNAFFNLAVALHHTGAHDEALSLFAQARLFQPSARSWVAYFDPHAH